MESKTFDQIMTGITAGLTGDPKADFAYLQEQMETYKEHPLSKEILRACGRLAWEILPDDKKAELSKAMECDQAGYDAILEEVAFNQKSGNPGRALELIEPLAKKLDESISEGLFADDTESRYFNFDSIAERIIWCAHNEEERDIRQVKVRISQVFLAYGSCLFEAQRYEDAIDALKKSIRWNPAKPMIRFELGENYKRLGDMDSYERVLDEAHPYIATASDMARFHRSKGFMLIERESYELAAAHLMYSLAYEESNLALSEIMYIKMKCGEDYTDLTPSSAAEILEREGDLSGANEVTLSALYSLIKLAADNGDADTAIHSAINLYELTGDEDIADLAKALIDAATKASGESE